MAKKQPLSQPNFFGSVIKPKGTPKTPLPDAIPDFRPVNPKAKKIYSPAPLPQKAVFPITIPNFRQYPPNPIEAAYLAHPTGDAMDQAIICYLIEHRHVPWPFSYLRIAAETGLDENQVHDRLKYWAWKKWYGVRRTSTGAYLAFLYHSEYFCLPS
jgi:hypothetical protein